jgi:hypothetical protein
VPGATSMARRDTSGAPRASTGIPSRT